MGEKPRYSIGNWEPAVVKEFLKAHGFEFLSRNGDEVCWKKGDNYMASFSETRQRLTPGTMRDSVMRQSGYSKKHWDKSSCGRRTGSELNVAFQISKDLAYLGSLAM